MQLRSGVDIELSARFDRLLRKPAFVREIYTENEQSYIEKSARPAQTAAGLYCAKEAAAKALGRGLFGLLPRELEICHDEAAVPVLRLHGSAQARYGGLNFALSISHSGDYAVAFCVTTGE